MPEAVIADLHFRETVNTQSFADELGSIFEMLWAKGVIMFFMPVISGLKPPWFNQEVDVPPAARVPPEDASKVFFAFFLSP